jgi:hypothetical protein
MKCIIKTSLTSLVLVILFQTAAYSAIIRVKPGGNDAYSGADWSQAKKTVQAAINAANEGDEIWVAAGTYAERIHNRLIKINNVDVAVNVALYGGFAGIETDRNQRNWSTNLTILDGTSGGVVVSITGGAGLTTRIDGLHITNGLGGVSMLGSAPTIANNTIRGNSGSGVSCSDYEIIGVSPPNVVFPVITNNIIVDNTSSSGGGIVVWGSDTIAMWNLPPSQPTITRNVIARNVAGDNGGGIGCWGHTAPLIANNFILANSAASAEYFFRGGGGGIYATSNDMSGIPVEYAISAPVIINNVIAANGAGLGAGICTIDTDIGVPVITNNTVVANNGSGIWWSTSYGNHAPMIRNNLVAFNTWGLEQVGTEYAATLRHNCVYGNTLQGKRTDYKGIADQTGANGNISADPKLANYKIGEFQLQPGSPCIDAGTLDAVGAGWTDIDGQLRIQGNGVDIGADESDGTFWNVPTPVIHVKPGGNDAQNGLTWATAKSTVSAGISAAGLTGGEVWVAAGTYTEHITIPAFVYLYGGFAGDESDRDGRDIPGNPTILDGSGIHGVVASRNAGYLVSALDGFTVRNGGVYTDGDWTKMYGPGGLGGGIYISVATPCIANNTITRNSLAYSNVYPNPPSLGGGIYCYLSYAEIAANTITENEILNTFDGRGGGIYCIHSMPTIKSNTITQNHARSGSAIFCEMSSPSIIDNVIENNTMYNTYPFPAYMGSYTGAVDLWLGQNFLIEGNLIKGNTGAAGGGINVSSNFAGRIQNNVIINNAASDPTAGNGGIGGGIYALAPLEALESLFILNNTIVGNTATAYGSLEQGGGIAVSIYPPIYTPPDPIPDRIVIANNIIAFNSSGIYETLNTTMIYPTLVSNDLYSNGGKDYFTINSTFPGGPTDIHLDPLFVNRAGGDFHLQQGSPCINAGSNAVIPVTLTTDFEGDPRIINITVDMGADEFKAGADTTSPTVTITSPTNNPTYSTNQPVISIGGTATDNVGITSVKWSNNRGGTGTCAGTSSWSATNISLFVGENVITVTARDREPDGNIGIDNLTVTYSPPANLPGTAPFSNVTQTCIRANWTDNGNPAGTQYFCENTTAGTDSGWITGTSWDSCSLACGSSYSFKVKARNEENVETGWTLLGNQSTSACPDLTPPETLIISGPGGNITVGDATFIFKGSDNVTPASSLLYATYLEGYDSGWSVFGTAATISYSNLPDGSYTFHVKAMDGAGNEDLSPAARSFTVSFQPPVSFGDVPNDNWAHGYVQAIYGVAVTLGCSLNPLQYCPANPVTRDQMASFLVRVVDGKNTMTCLGNVFDDVTAANPHCANIERLAALGITAGCTTGMYCPGNNVTREQMAAFIVRAVEGGRLYEGQCGGPSPFDDVLQTSPFCGNIERLVDLGVTQGCQVGMYCPTSNVLRDQMAAFLARAFLGMQ